MDIQKGNTAEVFDYDGERVCKLFYQEVPYEYVQQEYENARKLFELGIRVPEVFEIVNCDGRCGIIYEKIAGLPMWEHMQNECLFEKFIAEHKKLLDISTDVLMSYKDFMIAMISGGNNRKISGNIIKKISDLPDGNSVLHGDYHPGNVMLTVDGCYMEYQIREIRKEEYAILDEFLYEAIFVPEGVEAPPKSIIKKTEMQVYVSDFGKKDDCCLVAEMNGKIIGAVWTRIMNDYGHVDDNTPSFAISLYKDFRGQGIGTALMEEMLALLRERGYKKASLSVQKENYAYRLYQKVGFTIVGENDEEYIMVCDL